MESKNTCRGGHVYEDTKERKHCGRCGVGRHNSRTLRAWSTRRVQTMHTTEQQQMGAGVHPRQAGALDGAFLTVNKVAPDEVEVTSSGLSSDAPRDTLGHCTSASLVCQWQRTGERHDKGWSVKRVWLSTHKWPSSGLATTSCEK